MAPDTTLARRAAATVKGGGEAVTSTARRTSGPVRAAGFAAAGLAGETVEGLAAVEVRRTVLGMPIGRERAAIAAARRLAGAGRHVARTADDIHELRRHLEQANRQSPIEVLLNGLTHRRGANRAEH